MCVCVCVCERARERESFIQMKGDDDFAICYQNVFLQAFYAQPHLTSVHTHTHTFFALFIQLLDLVSAKATGSQCSEKDGAEAKEQETHFYLFCCRLSPTRFFAVV